MLVVYFLNLLFLMSPTQSFIFNNFEYLTQKMAPLTARAGTSDHETLWIEQKLDHFDGNEHRTWKMRYFRRLDIWKPNSPIYIYIGGEAEASPNPLYSGAAYELAIETSGALYATEHRYYGKSVPIKGTEAKSLKYLSARQALADIAYLIRTIKTNPMFSRSKVVVIGGSYPGNLATWMRLEYPNLVDAAIASSAPVMAKKDFYEYHEKVSYVLARYGTTGCWKAVNYQFMQYENMFKTKEGIERLKRIEKICPTTDMNIPENRQSFFSDKIFAITNALQNGDTTTVINQCLNFNTSKEASMPKGLWAEQRRCTDYNFNYRIQYAYKEISHNTAWLFQMCNEFGYFMSTSSKEQPFTNNLPVSYFVKMCNSVFGPDYTDSKIDKRINNINNIFGGLKPNVSKVVFVNGDLDPWSRLGVLKDLSEDAPAIVIPRASHCQDLLSNQAGDGVELIYARRNIKNYIKKWIGATNFAH